MSELSHAATLEYQHHYERGWSLLKAAIAKGPRVLSVAEGELIDEAKAHLMHCLSMLPDSWQCMWGMGKACQQLSAYKLALAWFERALTLEHTNDNVFREAALEALALGDASKALHFSSEAIHLNAKDAGLCANLALAHMIAGQDEAAL